MSKFGKKFLSVSFSILGGITFVVGINAIIFDISKKESTTKFNATLLNQSFDKNEDKDMIKFYKENTISICFVKNTYEKTNGTAWLKDYNDQMTEFTFATNLHVVADYLHINKDGHTLSLNSNFDGINVRYFNNINNDNLFLKRTKVSDWSIAKSYANLSRRIPSQFKSYNNVDFDPSTYTTSINNGYIDYIELTYHLNKGDVSDFAKWLRKRKYVPKVASQSEINSFLWNAYNVDGRKDGVKKNDYLYIAGFPSINLEPKWVEQKFPIVKDASSYNTYFTSSVHEVSAIPWLEKNDGIKLNSSNGKTIQQRSISHQLIFNGLIMGSGSSGSMVCGRINNEIKIFAIWWGTYGKRMGAGDLLWSNSYNAYNPKELFKPREGSTSETAWEDWSGYNVTL